MKKTLPAFLAALLITAILGVGMFVIGQDVLAASPAQTSTETTTILVPESSTQLEEIIMQYQNREVQYQTELDSAIERLDAQNQQLLQANQQIEEYQNLLTQLQSNELVTITNDGTVTVNQPSFSPRGDHPERNH